MKPNNNSDNDLLVWADWLDENGFERIAEDVRDEVENPKYEIPWQFEYRRVYGNVGGSDGVGMDVGGGGISVGVGGVVGVGVGGGFDSNGVGVGSDGDGGVGGNVGWWCWW